MGSPSPGSGAAARLGDGWISVQNTEAEITAAIDDLRRYRAEYGRCRRCRSRSTRCAWTCSTSTGTGGSPTRGVTELQAVPWYFYGGDPNDLQVQLDSLARFADEVITRF